jgi:hypothetical protein
VSSGAYAQTLERAEEIREIGARSADGLLERAGLCHRGSALHHLGRLRESIDCLTAARDIAAGISPERIGDLEYPSINACAWLSLSYAVAGFADRSRAAVAAGLEWAHAVGHPFSVCYVTAGGSCAAVLRGDWDEGCRLGSEAARLGGEQGFSWIAAVGK